LLTTPTGVTVTEPGPSGPPVADLFTEVEDRIGVHADKLIVCIHAATTFGPAFNTSERDLTVYWEENGPVHGRTVEVTYENDNDDPTMAAQAAAACKRKGPFIMFGGVGYDQTPVVRKFVEDNHMFYMTQVAPEDPTKRYSFSTLPTTERLGDLSAQWTARRFKGKKVGIIYRESERWDSGRFAYVKRLQALRTNVIVGQRGVGENQGTYFIELNELQQAGAQLVFVWDSPLAATAMIQQAKGQNWSPQWLVPTWNQTTDALGDQALDPPLHGLAVRPAYSPGDYTGPFASYATELKRFEAAYAKHRPNVRPTDIHWWVWLAHKELHYFLLKCGRNCTRNKLLGLFLWKEYTAAELAPGCGLDFTRVGYVGGFWATVFTAYRRADGRAGWRNLSGQVCRESFLD
jgi:ABC-type branched-subunit amino acid transport system substrate-binding protein